MTDSNTPRRPENLDVLLVTASCPSCAATVKFSSITSVMSVCEYCQANVVREGENLREQGKQSLVIEDYSPLKMGSYGQYGNHEFTVIGRVQYQYHSGTWNEWRIQFNNGKTAWLSEALGEYTLTYNGRSARLASYDELVVDSFVKYKNVEYTITDKRQATIVGCEGELPVLIQSGKIIHVIDARFERKFITLDYAEDGSSQTPIVFQGIGTSLESLNMQGLKDDQQREKTSLTDTVDIERIDCPNCGYPLPYVAGATNCLVCPSCSCEIELSGGHADIVSIHSMMQAQKTSLSLGDSARIIESEIDSVSTTRLNDYKKSAPSNKHHDFTIIGIVRLTEVGEYGQWTEYLLYSKTDGFLWLAEESSGWHVARVLNELPKKSAGNIIFRDEKWRRLDVYHNKVTYAIGAFNWKVNLNDSMKLIDYSCKKDMITSEQDASEITYTLATPISKQRVEKWFGKSFKVPILPPRREEKNSIVGIIITVVIIIVLLTMLKSCDFDNKCSNNNTSTTYPKKTYQTNRRCSRGPSLLSIGASLLQSSGRSGFSSSGSHK